MIARLNLTGTHKQKTKIKVRIDLYPEVGDQTFALDGGSTSPMGHFIKINPNTTEAALIQMIASIFDGTTVSLLDGYLMGGNLAEIGNLMSTKCGTGGDDTTNPNNLQKLIDRLNKRFDGLEVQL